MGKGGLAGIAGSSDLLSLLIHRVTSLELRLETQQSSVNRVQNLVYDKIPSFERRITQLQNQVKQLLEHPTDNTGIIRLQSTPRYDSTLAVSRGALALGSRLREGSATGKLSSMTPEPEHETRGFEETAPQCSARLRISALRGMAEMANHRAITPLLGEDTRSGLDDAVYAN